MSIHWPIIKRCLFHPKCVGIVDDSKTYKGFHILAGALHLAAHIKRNSQTDTLGILLPTSGAFPIAALAGWITGKVVVPLNYLLTEDELQYVVDDCGTDTILTATPLLKHLEFEPKVKNLIKLDELELKGVPPLTIPARAADDDLAVLLYTSGTSGRPKGVMLTHANIGANVRQVQNYAHFTCDDVMLGVLPQFHSFGLTVLTIVPLTVGAKIVCTARFVPAKIIKLMKEHRATTFVAIPSMYNALMRVKKAEPEDVASLRFAVSGGEPLPEAVFDGFLERFGIRICEGYGLTETAPCTNWCSPEGFVRHSVGPPLDGVRQRIVDIESGKDLPAGEEGEIRIAGPNVMKGYYNLPDATADAFDEQGYFRTGDIGRFDEDGNLFITGRLKEMLIVGGENVFPREIEEVVNKHPDIADSGVIGIEDPVRGEVPVAYVELVEDATLDVTSVQSFCRDHLAGYKVPRHVIALDALPRNPTGKIMRRALKEIAETDPALADD